MGAEKTRRRVALVRQEGTGPLPSQGRRKWSDVLLRASHLALQIRSSHCGGRMPERTSPKAMARRAEGGTPAVNREGSSTPLSPPDKKKAPHGGSVGFFCCVSRDMFVPSLGLTLRALRGGPAFRLSKIVPDNFVEPEGSPTPSLSARYEKSPFRGFFRIWRRERDSNPR
jgi:hypothetical protein